MLFEISAERVSAKQLEEHMLYIHTVVWEVVR